VSIATLLLNYRRFMIDLHGPIPRYLQIADEIAGRIERGELRPNKPIPSEKQLVGEHGVTRNTVRHAVDVLRQRGLVYTVPHRGTYVCPRPDGG
jgi:DNA-binding GntR family transcriptional regulator